MSGATVFLFIAGMAILAFADFSIKQAAGKITPALGATIYGVVAAVPPLVWLAWTRAHEPLLVTQDGVLWAISTGVAFGVFTGLLFVIFSQGVDLSIGSPVIRMGGIVIAASLGILVFRETINWHYLLGFAFAAVGILLVITR